MNSSSPYAFFTYCYYSFRVLSTMLSRLIFSNWYFGITYAIPTKIGIISTHGTIVRCSRKKNAVPSVFTKICFAPNTTSNTAITTGKRVRTKKEIIGEDGQIRKGCTVIKKGDVYESHRFTVKDDKFKSEPFLREVKEIYIDLINRHISDPKQQLKVFDKNSVYLPTKKIGKNNPKAAEIEADNTARQEMYLLWLFHMTDIKTAGRHFVWLTTI